MMAIQIPKANAFLASSERSFQYSLPCLIKIPRLLAVLPIALNELDFPEDNFPDPILQENNGEQTVA